MMRVLALACMLLTFPQARAAGTSLLASAGIVGIVGVLLYKYLKSRLVRERPYISLAGIVPGTPAALATASAISPASAPWRNPPVKSRLTKSASSSVARPSNSVSIRLRSPAEPLPVAA